MPSNVEDIDDGSKVRANLVMIWFIRAKENAQPHELGLVSHVLGEIEVRDGQDADRVMIPSFAQAMGIEEVEEDLESQSHATTAVDEELFGHRALESPQKLGLEHVIDLVGGDLAWRIACPRSLNGGPSFIAGIVAQSHDFGVGQDRC